MQLFNVEMSIEGTDLMTFTGLGKFVAYTIAAISLLRLLAAVYVATISENIEQLNHFSKRYFAGSSPGDVIDKSVVYIIGAIVLGILCEISSKIEMAAPRQKPSDK